MVLDIAVVGLHAIGSVLRSSMVSNTLPPSIEGLLILISSLRRLSILATFTLYAIAGRELFQKRQQLRAFNTPANLNPFDSFKTTDVLVTSELATMDTLGDVLAPSNGKNRSQRSTASGKNYEQYSVNIMSSPMTPRPSVAPHTSMVSMQNRKNRVAMDANRAAWAYTKVALLFFVSLLVTWVRFYPFPASQLV